MQPETNAVQRTFEKSVGDKLKELGFEKTEFEPIVQNRFIVDCPTIPNYLVHGADLPHCTFYRNKELKKAETRWDSLVLYLYNPVEGNLEKKIIELGLEDDVDIDVRYLGPGGEVSTHWKIKAELTVANWGTFGWDNSGDPNIITLTFRIKEATLN